MFADCVEHVQIKNKMHLKCSSSGICKNVEGLWGATWLRAGDQLVAPELQVGDPCCIGSSSCMLKIKASACKALCTERQDTLKAIAQSKAFGFVVTRKLQMSGLFLKILLKQHTVRGYFMCLILI